MKDDLKAELELAVAELAFWLDFAKWWRGEHCGEEAPRMREILEYAETRCERAAREIRTESKYDGVDH